MSKYKAHYFINKCLLITLGLKNVQLEKVSFQLSKENGFKFN